jgi:hypothetical protein
MLGTPIYGLGPTNGRIGPWGWVAKMGVLQEISGIMGQIPETARSGATRCRRYAARAGPSRARVASGDYWATCCAPRSPSLLNLVVHKPGLFACYELGRNKLLSYTQAGALAPRPASRGWRQPRWRSWGRGERRVDPELLPGDEQRLHGVVLFTSDKVLGVKALVRQIQCTTPSQFARIRPCDAVAAGQWGHRA